MIGTGINLCSITAGSLGGGGVPFVPTFTLVGQTAYQTSFDQTHTLPETTQAGDLLVVLGVSGGAYDAALSTSSTQVSSVGGAFVRYREAGAGETTFRFRITSVVRLGGTILQFRRNSGSASAPVANDSITTGLTHTANPAIASRPALVIWNAATVTNAGTVATTYPAGFTPVVDRAYAADGVNSYAHDAGYKIFTGLETSAGSISSVYAPSAGRTTYGVFEVIP